MFLRRICVLRRGATAYWRQGYAKRVLVVAEGVAAVELRGNDSPARVYAFTAEVGGLTGDGRFEGFLSTLSGAGGRFLQRHVGAVEVVEGAGGGAGYWISSSSRR
jgi:hypothetical protein